jgi:hypothetical protein
MLRKPGGLGIKEVFSGFLSLELDFSFENPEEARQAFPPRDGLS